MPIAMCPLDSECRDVSTCPCAQRTASLGLQLGKLLSSTLNISNMHSQNKRELQKQHKLCLRDLTRQWFEDLLNVPYYPHNTTSHRGNTEERKCFASTLVQSSQTSAFATFQRPVFFLCKCHTAAVIESMSICAAVRIQSSLIVRFLVSLNIWKH